MKKLLLLILMFLISACATTKPLPLNPYKPTTSADPIIESLLRLENNPGLLQDGLFMKKFQREIQEAGLCDACQKGDAK